MSVLLDTNVVLRYLTRDPPAQATRGETFLRRSRELVLLEIVVAEMVYVLDSVYGWPRQRTAEAIRSLLALPSIVAQGREVLLRAADVYEHTKIHFSEAYLVAAAELTGARRIASFDRDLDRVTTVERIEP